MDGLGMVDQRIEKLAKLCIHYSIDVKPKGSVIIEGSASAFPLMHEIYKECLLSDAYPMILPSLETQYTFYRYAREHQLKHVSPFQKFLVENIDVSIGIFCEPNPKALTNVGCQGIGCQGR
jgi:aminopeptidase